MDARSYQNVSGANSHICHSTCRLREVFFVVMMSFAVLTVISLVELQPGIDQHGWGFFLTMYFGKAAYLVPAIFIYAGCLSYLHWQSMPRTGRLLILRCFGISLLFISVIATVQMISGQGGDFGYHLVTALRSHFLFAEIWVGCVSVLLIGITLVSRISWYVVVSKIIVQTKLFFVIADSPTVSTQLKSAKYDLSYEKPNSKRVSPISPIKQRALHDATHYQSGRLVDVLRHFDIDAQVHNVQQGPVVTRFELSLSAGTKSSVICNLQKDIARALAVEKVRVIEAIPGTTYIGIELPNDKREFFDYEQLTPSVTQENQCVLPILLGKTTVGENKVVDLASMPHLLVAGSTQSGKTMLLQSVLLTLTDQLTPDALKIILIDPKLVAFTQWNNSPHLLNPVITDANEAIGVLSWCVEEMERRYQAMASGSGENQSLPKIVVVIDELSDLVMINKGEIETAVIRLAQKARQSGIHLVLSTQRPSADIITGHIKANITNRIALSVAERRDSRIILDENGAYRLYLMIIVRMHIFILYGQLIFFQLRCAFIIISGDELKC